MEESKLQPEILVIDETVMDQKRISLKLKNVVRLKKQKITEPKELVIDPKDPKKLTIKGDKQMNTQPNFISDIAMEALQRGGGRACVASHAGGCRHYGILDLYPMDTRTYAFYVKKNGWLTNKCCTVCQQTTSEMSIDKVTKTLLRYCEMGLKSIKLNRDGDEDKKQMFIDHDCNMIMCVPCWNLKVLDYENEIMKMTGSRSKRCSNRKRI